MSDKLYGPVKDGKTIAETVTEDIKMPTELTERQRRIVKYRLRGLTQKAIAGIEQVSQPMIAKEVRKIRKVFAEQGSQIEQNVVVGESVNLFQEIEQRAWELYYKSKDGSAGDANKALNTVMTAREKTIKLLMDLGLIKRAAITHEHNMKLPPFLEEWNEKSEEDKRTTISEVIGTQLPDLEEPTPPELPDDIDYADYEEVSDEEENE